jgi:hypothetical protein
MISRKGLDDLAAEYREASRRVNEVGTILDDTSVMASGAGAGVAWVSTRLTTAVNDLCAQFDAALKLVDGTRPND